MYDKKCSILVNSCDKFKDAWHPYFTLLLKYWPKCPYKLFLNTESSICSFEGVTTLNSASDSWSGRLIESLKKIETDFVILSLEDFFLMGQVKERAIEAILEVMQNDSSIAVVYPKQISTYHSRDDLHPEWIRMDFDFPKIKKYLINFQFAIWNKNTLIDLLEVGKTPWQIEREYVLSPDNIYKFYCIPLGNKLTCKDDVFPYLFAIQKGYGIANSKWLWNNKHLFKKEHINVNFEGLGVLSYYQYIYNKIVDKIKLLMGM